MSNEFLDYVEDILVAYKLVWDTIKRRIPIVKLHIQPIVSEYEGA